MLTGLRKLKSMHQVLHFHRIWEMLSNSCLLQCHAGKHVMLYRPCSCIISTAGHPSFETCVVASVLTLAPDLRPHTGKLSALRSGAPCSVSVQALVTLLTVPTAALLARAPGEAERGAGAAAGSGSSVKADSAAPADACTWRMCCSCAACMHRNAVDLQVLHAWTLWLMHMLHNGQLCGGCRRLYQAEMRQVLACSQRCTEKC